MSRLFFPGIHHKSRFQSYHSDSEFFDHTPLRSTMPNRNKTRYEFGLTPVTHTSAHPMFIDYYFNLIPTCSDIPPLNILLESANALLASTVRWPPGKTYYDGLVQTFSHKEASGPNWHGRLRYIDTFLYFIHTSLRGIFYLYDAPVTTRSNTEHFTSSGKS